MANVLITGVLGQDGSNMAEFLLKNTRHKVYGMMRRSATPNYQNVESFSKTPRFELVNGDLTDEISINRLVKTIKPKYLINFGANSFVGLSATINQRVKIGKECIIGAGTLITKDVNDKEVYAENSSKKLPQSSDEIGNMI